MKCAIFFALVALSSANPLTSWGDVGEGNYHSRGFFGLYGQQVPQKEMAHRVAADVTQETIHDQLAHTNEAIRSLQWKLQQYPHSWSGYSHGVYDDLEMPHHFGADASRPYGFAHQMAHQMVEHVEPSVGIDAIKHLEDDMVHQQHQFTRMGSFGYPQDRVTQQLYDTVETGVEAHLAGRDVHHQQVFQGVDSPLVPGLYGEVFQTRLHKLVNEHNEQEIEKQIDHHHHWAQQLHHQQEFVNQQKQEIKIQLALAKHQVTPEHIHHLEQTYQQLHMQECHLIQEQLAHHLAILELQKAMIHKEQEVLHDTVAEHLQERVVEGTYHPFLTKNWSF